MKFAALVRASVAVSAVVLASTAVGDAAKPNYGPWGFDLTARDVQVKPGDNFFDHASGVWLKSHEIPSDQPSISVGRDIYDRTQEQIRTLIDSSAARPTTPTARQIGGLYKSFMDEDVVEKKGDAALKADLAAIDAAKTKADFTVLMGKAHGNYGLPLFPLAPFADAKRPVVAVYIGQGGLGMPDRDYYLTDNFKDKKDAYEAYITRTFKMLGDPAPEATAKTVLAFETAVAEASWPAAERRDIEKVYNPMKVAALATYAPGVEWRAYLDAGGAKGLDDIVVLENTAVQKIAKLYQDTPLATLKAWQKFQTASNAAPYLSKAYVDSRFEFVEKALNGTQTLRPRWKRGVELVNGNLGEAVGREYVAQYFPPEAKAKMDALVANLKVAMAARIDKLEWMSATTKEQAKLKLSKMQVMIGYPVKWRDYSALQIDAGDLYGNVSRATAFEWAYQMSKVAKPVDKTEWAMTPQTVDAYNGGLENKIVFPAGILQPPMFNLSADPAVNYGAIGAVIGHEITHGFDDQGRKMDADGKLRDWWTPEDAKKFTAEADKLAAQYDAYEVLPGTHINGKLTLGENIADLGGLLVAVDAYHASLGGKPAPVLDGLTGDQRVFLGYAQSWRGKARDDAIKVQVASDPHSPRRYRVLGATRNIDGWYSAFGVQPGEKFYLKAEDRVRVW